MTHALLYRDKCNILIQVLKIMEQADPINLILRDITVPSILKVLKFMVV